MVIVAHPLCLAVGFLVFRKEPTALLGSRFVKVIDRTPKMLVVTFEEAAVSAQAQLLNFAADLRENGVGVVADYSYHADSNHENDRQHDRVFSDILSFSGLAQID